MSWALTSEQPVPPGSESHLEQSFRDLFTRRVTALGATVKESPGPQGNRLTITFPSATRQWTLEPQVLMTGSKPDFVLSSGQGSLPPVAIFTDGWQYHASPAHNRIADDADKRQVLRDGGAVVVGITARDVEDAQSGPGSAPAWWRDDVIAELLGSSVTFSTHDAEAVRAGPMGFLLGWIQNPHPSGHATLADHLPLMFAPGAIHLRIDPAADLTREAALRLTDPHRAATGEPNAWWWTNGLVGCLTRHTGQVLEVALVLDDRDEALHASGHADAWRQWLRISNALNLRGQPTSIAAVTDVLSQPAAARPAPVSGVGQALPPDWQELRDLTLEGPERSFLEELFRLGPVPLPVLGHETDGGVPIDFAWPDRHIAVCFDEGDGQAAQSDGWDCLPPDPAAVAAALKGAA
jgi:hypothetical protein